MEKVSKVRDWGTAAFDVELPAVEEVADVTVEVPEELEEPPALVDVVLTAEEDEEVDCVEGPVVVPGVEVVTCVEPEVVGVEVLVVFDPRAA